MAQSLTWGHVFLFLITVFALMWFSEKFTRSNFVGGAVCIFMICVAGLRHGYIDTRAYRQGFIRLDVKEIFSSTYIFGEEGFDKGFSVLSAIIKLFTEESQVFLFVFSFLTVGLLFWGIYRNVENRWMGIFLFVTTGCYLDTMNGLRQAFVSAVLFFFLPKLIEQKKFLKFLIIVLLASTVHASALIFIPLYFISSKPKWSSNTLVLLFFLGIAFVFFNSGIGENLANLLEGTRYGDSYGEMLRESNTSVNVIRIFVSAVPLILSLYNHIGAGKSTNEMKPIETIAFNMSLISFCCWFFATRVLYFYRLAMYFQPYVILLLCFEIANLKNEKDKTLISIAAAVCYLIFHLYTLYVAGDNFFVGYLKY